MRDASYVNSTDPNRPTSRYNKIRIYVDDNGNMVQETLYPPTIEERDDDIYHEVGPEESNRPDLISLVYYNSAPLYWIIALANGLTDPFAETVAGLKLRIPSADYVFSEILVK